MNPFSVVSHIQSNLPSLSTALLQRRKSTVVNVVVQSSPLTKTAPSTTTTTTTTTTRTHPLSPHGPTSTITTTIVEEQKEEQELTEQAPAPIVASVPNKPRNNPQAIIGNFDGATEAEMEAKIEPTMVNFSTDLGSKNLNRHSIHIMPVSTPPVVAEEKNLQRIALRRHTSFPTPNTVQSSPANDGNGLPERAASLDGYDRAKVLKSSPSDAVQATTMISQPRRSHLKHNRSSSLPLSLVAPAQSLRSPATVPTSHAPASLLSNIPAVDSSMVESDDDSEEDSEDTVEDSEEDSEEDGAEEHSGDQDQSNQPRSQFGSVSDLAAAAAAPALAASTLGKEAVIITPPASPSLNAAATAAKAPTTVPVSAPAPIVVAPALPSPPTSSPPSPSPRKTTFTSSAPAPIMVVSHQNSPSIPPSSPIHSITYVSPTASSTTTTSKTTTTTTTTTTAIASPPSAASVPSPVSIVTPSIPSTPSTPPSAPAPVTTAAAPTPPASSPSTASSFLSAWQGRSRAMMPTILRPSPMMPFHAARKVVSSVTTAGTGLLPTKEQLNSIPVAGRILSHPVMDSTLSYIAEKASERGIDFHALTGGIDPKKLIRPEDVPYRKLNKTMIHQAMTLSVLAVQKEELSKAMDDEDGDDAFELYLAAVNTLLHSLPFETCDPLRREAFETQLRSFLDQLCQKDDLSETGSTPKKLRRRRRRRHRQHHDQATSLIHQHTQETTAEPTTSQGHQRRQQIRQKNLQREQHIKQQQLMVQQQALEKQQQQEQKEKRRQDKKIAAAMAAAAASQKQQPGKASAPAQQDRPAAKKSSKRSSHSRRRQAAQYAQHPHEGYDDQNNNNGGGLGDTIISTAVHSAIRLKQSPIPDVVKSCLRTSKTIFNKVDERFHLQDKAWELSKNSIEKAMELDEQYAIHEVVTETVFATLTGLVKAGIAYKESPSYTAVRAAASENSKIEAAPPVQVLESATLSRSLHPQGAQPSSKRSSKSKKAATALKEKEKAAAAAAAAAASRSSITSRWTRRPQSVVVESEASSDSEQNSDDSDSDSDSDSEVEQQKTNKTFKSKVASSSASSSSSAFSSGSSSCSSTAGSGAENDSDSDSDNETVELNHETLRPSSTSRGYRHRDTSKLPPPPPYSEQVREKIDMFMALKGAASLLVGSL
ncbi:hypothetical protein EC957_002196 [Mortierella hygrophila]|uniref:Uncharacterized protein n=1 Tax=Mortierella hygrophila TaxID=979708 RepID=A0A9P6F3S0_9FUNG|nr:hypothetical protein EC957_002196 [Mortierella hygrophila]